MVPQAEMLPRQTFILGYGSLMKKMSRIKTKCSLHSISSSGLQGILEFSDTDDDGIRKCLKEALATKFILVKAKGIRRGWYSRGKLQAEKVNGFKNDLDWQDQALDVAPTYLGAVEDPNSECFAVIYPVDEDELALTDERERMGTYQPAWVNASTLEVLTPNFTMPEGSKIRWYAMDEKMVEKPTSQFPICQSYVDLVIGGALELGDENNVPDFAKNVAVTTDAWSPFWVNDRKVPYRPLDEEVKAHWISDTLMEATLVENSTLTKHIMSAIHFPTTVDAIHLPAAKGGTQTFSLYWPLYLISGWTALHARIAMRS